ncbi:hypothetical protein MJD09_10985 [bacterium]|nr:hypothetical protein [bacterium]
MKALVGSPLINAVVQRAKKVRGCLQRLENGLAESSSLQLAGYRAFQEVESGTGFCNMVVPLPQQPPAKGELLEMKALIVKRAAKSFAKS